MGTKRDLVHAALPPDGKTLGAPSPVVEKWDSLSLPRLLAAPDGSLRALFGGLLGSPQRDDPRNKGSLYTAVSKDGGRTWQLAQEAQSPSAKLYAAYLGAAMDKDGRPLAAFTDGGRVLLQPGLGAAVPLETVHDGACCTYHAQMAVDGSSGEAWAAWHQNTSKDPGIYVRAVKPAAGVEQLVPGSQVNNAGQLVSPGPNQQIAMAARVGAPGVYVAYLAGYPSAKELKLWSVRGGEPLTAATLAGARHTAIAPAPEGRYWLLWVNQNHTASAVRTNKALTRLSKPYEIGSPAPSGPLWHLLGEGSTGPLDALAHVDVGGPDNSATFHTRVYPNLEVAGGTSGVTVTDVGDPVEGVEVTVEGKTLKTDSSGFAAHPLTPGKPTPVRASHPAYAAASTTITPPKPPAAKKK